MMSRFLFLSLITLVFASGCSSETKTDAEAKIPASDLGEEAMVDPGAAMLEDLAPEASTTADKPDDPAAGQPDSTAPDSTAPDSTAPDSTAPDSTAPDSTAPDSTAPDSSGTPAGKDKPARAETDKPSQDSEASKKSNASESSDSNTFVEVDRDEEDE
jgi:hypothetical protein